MIFLLASAEPDDIVGVRRRQLFPYGAGLVYGCKVLTPYSPSLQMPVVSRRSSPLLDVHSSASRVAILSACRNGVGARPRPRPGTWCGAARSWSSPSRVSRVSPALV